MTALALPALFLAVRAGFSADRSSTPNDFGWREPTRQTKELSGRVMWVPGDPQGEVGELGSAVKPGRTGGRPLATLDEQCTIYFYGADTSNIEDELAQYIAARELFDYWWKIVYHAAQTVGQGGRVTMSKLAWIIEKKERPHGRVLRGLLLVEAAVRDTPQVYAGVPAVADLNTGLSNDFATITTSDGTVHIEPEPTV